MYPIPPWWADLWLDMQLGRRPFPPSLVTFIIQPHLEYEWAGSVRVPWISISESLRWRYKRVEVIREFSFVYPWAAIFPRKTTLLVNDV